MPKGIPNPVSTGVYTYVPCGLEIKSFGSDAQKLENEVHWFIWRVISRRHQRRHSHDDYVEVPNSYMRQFIHPRKAEAVRRLLIDNNVIQCDGKYLSSNLAGEGNGYAMSYRLADGYHERLKMTEITNQTLADRIKAHRLTFCENPITAAELNDTHRHLFNWLRRTRIDAEGAYRAIEEVAARKALKAYYKSLNHMAVDRLARGEFEFSVCKYGRVHTNVTNLLSAARPCLSINGEPLFNLDIRNSQIVFFLLLLQEHKQALMDSASPPQSNRTAPPFPYMAAPPLQGPITIAPSLYPICRTNEKRLGKLRREEEQRFADLVMGGTFYDYLMSKLGATERGPFKADFFRAVIYGDNRQPYSYTNPLYKLFECEFPSVLRFIRHKKSETFQELAREMQRRESKYMIRGVCGRLMNDHPEVPVLTIHDSILTTKQHANLVHGIMMDEFRRLGVTPTVRRE